MPKRIRMSRQRPWRADNPDAVIVARPSPWGNPFAVGRDYIVSTPDGEVGELLIPDRAAAVAAFRAWLAGEVSAVDLAGARAWMLSDVGELAGRDLACWCPLEDAEGNRAPCHADVLLELANA